MKTPFLNPKLDGTRFDEHSVPLGFLKDWAAFEELIVDVARALYLSENPERKRVPGGFYDSFALHLSRIDEGSAVPVIDQVRPDANAKLTGLFERSRDLVLGTIAAAAIGAAIPAEFPRECLAYFDQFGKSLRPDEQIELVVPGKQGAVTYDATARKKLVLLGAPEYRQIAILRGRVTAVDVEKHTFMLTLVVGDRVHGETPADYAKAIHAALDPNGSTKVVIRGLVVYDPNDRAKNIEKIAHFEQLDPNDVPFRLEELALLKDGWLDGYGKAPGDKVGWLIRTWEKEYSDDLPTPFAYPTPEGGIQLEWTIGQQWEVSVDVNLTTKRAELTALKVGTDTSADAEADLGTSAGWKLLAQYIRSFMAQ